METIDPRKLLLKVVPILDKLQINYFVTGGFAVTLWGRMRTTNDIDMVIQLVEPQVKPLAEALRKISAYGYIDEETAVDAVRKNGEFNFIDPDTGYKVDFWVGKNDEIIRREFERKRVQAIDSVAINFLSPEDLILQKLVWHQETNSDRHSEDIASILRRQKNDLDFDYLRKWTKAQGTDESLESLMAKQSE